MPATRRDLKRAAESARPFFTIILRLAPKEITGGMGLEGIVFEAARRALSQRAIQDVAEVEPLSEAVRREREEAWN